MTPLEELAHALKIKYRLPPDRPTESELIAIMLEIAHAANKKGRVTDADWSAAVRRTVSFEGHYIYQGLDFSDLNALLLQAIRDAQSTKR